MSPCTVDVCLGAACGHCMSCLRSKSARREALDEAARVCFEQAEAFDRLALANPTHESAWRARACVATTLMTAIRKLEG